MGVRRNNFLSNAGEDRELFRLTRLSASDPHLRISTRISDPHLPRYNRETMPLAPGDRLGPYEILSPLGAGGMGEVWKARDTRLGRIVAIKQLKGHHTARFEQEARAIDALNHPHVCQIYDVGPNYIVME